MSMNLFIGIGGASLAICAAMMALVALKALRRQQVNYESLESSFAALRRELEMLASISARTGRRVQRVEHEYSDVADRVDVVESRGAPASGPGSLDQAIDWARRGAGPDKLSQQFGMSRGEAELVIRLHGRKRAG